MFFSSRMPPRRDNQIATAELAEIIAQQMAAQFPNLFAQWNQANNNNNGTCKYKDFSSAKPLKFSGSEGATGLLQWFESIENTFRHVQCPDNRKVEFSSSVFQKRALTWWNGVMRDQGAEVALAQTWAELRALMMREFCPRHEQRALEKEFDVLKQDSGEHRAYTDRFEELSLLCPTMVTPLDKAIERYIDGLPDSVQDILIGSNPTTLRQAIELSATLTESQIRKNKLHRKGDKGKKQSADKEDSKKGQNKKGKDSGSSRGSRKRKASQNFAVTAQANQAAPNQPPAKKPYSGSAPLCNRCNSHHQPQYQCRFCTNCGKSGHLADVCRFAQNHAVQNPAQQVAQQQGQAARPNYPPGACYNCGDLTHYRNRCPRLVNQNQNANQNPAPARGRVFNMNAQEAQADNEVVNGTFFINNQPASVLFDSGADKSFVSLSFETMLRVSRIKLGKPLTVEVASGEPIVLNSVLRNCQLNLNEHIFPIDLTPMQLGSFDVIVGMDWLSKHHAEIVCSEKIVRVPLSTGEILQVHGEKPAGGLKLMSCFKARKYLRKHYVAF
ncbi:putative transcription factor interactor and regulator CCHC(Zn) family [Helianthus annuus]|nr:putative transcription factor interactor and regulator CCHC(Zn) family [Helianthus annuus]